MVGGRELNEKSYPWSGEVYAIRLYDRELTSAEIARNHALDLYRFGGDGAVANSFVRPEMLSARIAIVQVTGAGDDVAEWNDEVAGTSHTLVHAAGEGEITWHAKRGVWKAVFEIRLGDNVLFTESARFDLRTLGRDGTVIIFK